MGGMGADTPPRTTLGQNKLGMDWVLVVDN